MEMLSRPKAAETILDLSTPRERPVARDYRDDSPARGIVIGIAISAVLWAAIIAALI
jgi:hypothetical protein